MSNLLTNAAKYTGTGGQIAIAARREDGQAVISVTDNGVGIEPTMLRRVFEPFAQEHQSIDRAQGGLGLGLAIVDNLVKLHGGTAVAASAGRGHGSTFTVRLPLRTTTEVSHPEIRLPRRSAPRDARILLVDDNIDAAQLLAELLAADGYRTLVAHDGPSALQAARSFEPEIAVVDLGLPIMDGYELGRHLLARDGGPAVRLIALTGYGQAEDRARTAAAGFEIHLVKPVDVAQLRSAIERLLPRAGA
jgi:CheY-like chemotaxis protein